MKMQVQSLALFSRLRIQHGCKLQHRSQIQLRSNVAVAETQAAAALIRPLDLELPCATGVAIKRKKHLWEQSCTLEINLLESTYPSSVQRLLSLEESKHRLKKPLLF